MVRVLPVGLICFTLSVLLHGIPRQALTIVGFVLHRFGALGFAVYAFRVMSGERREVHLLLILEISLLLSTLIAIYPILKVQKLSSLQVRLSLPTVS